MTTVLMVTLGIPIAIILGRFVLALWSGRGRSINFGKIGKRNR